MQVAVTMPDLFDAATRFKRYLENGERVSVRVVGANRTVECFQFMGESDVLRMRALRSELKAATNKAYDDPVLRPAADKLACHPAVFQVDQTVNLNSFYTSDGQGTPMVPFVENVRAENADRIGRALAQLKIDGAITESVSDEGTDGNLRTAAEVTLTEMSEKYDIPKSVISKAANLPPDDPGFLRSRTAGRSRLIPKDHAAAFAENYGARREVRSLRSMAADR